MSTDTAASRDYRVVEAALRRLADDWRAQPSLDASAAAAGLSPYHFQRLFTRWAGVSPKRFVQLLTLAHAKARLRAADTVLAAAYDSGLSGPARLHDLFVNLEGVTPGEYRSLGTGLLIHHGNGPTPFGEAVVAWTERGICALRFTADAEADDPLGELSAEWPGATHARDDAAAAALLARIFVHPDRRPATASPLRLFVRATPFQLHVWRALLQVPPGSLVTYDAIARAIGRPTAARAVGQAIGRNPLAYLVPCHRVIRSVGGFGGYRWGVPRKLALIGWEAAAAGAAGPHE